MRLIKQSPDRKGGVSDLAKAKNAEINKIQAATCQKNEKFSKKPTNFEKSDYKNQGSDYN